MKLKILNSAVAIGICMGILAPFVAMIPTTSKTEAAIAVFDERNIQEAATTAIKTAKILTEEEKQLALMVLNAKKLDGNMLLDWVSKNQKIKDEIFNFVYDNTGFYGTLIGGSVINAVTKQSIFNVGAGDTSGGFSLDDVWKGRIGDVEAITTGKLTIVDAYNNEQKRKKMVQDTAMEIVERGKRAGKTNEEIMKMVDDELAKQKDYEGTNQILQSGNRLKGIGIYAIINNTEVVNNGIKGEAVYYGQKALSEWQQRQEAENARKVAEENAKKLASELGGSSDSSSSSSSGSLDANTALSLTGN